MNGTLLLIVSFIGLAVSLTVRFRYINRDEKSREYYRGSYFPALVDLLIVIAVIGMLMGAVSTSGPFIYRG
ncbi:MULTISPECIES: hypothetical protein [Enterobacteriaceae]|jgi:hypothetical protein|nr:MULTISPECIES: hypothetical protein [Enterobacteriaceae]EOQ51062.1 hypothetical protein WC7_00025 [Citrobacter sp. KTE151]HAN7473666.1 hypothetical protein [Escherichia coli]HBQ8114646.1 hypothetical protein [Klebsiella pneumoniae]AUO66029.1 hypothetical protein WM46_15425 [Citrobacter freundii complex sp. CFNIH2]MEB6621586.1 hypothetical protein [Enterobacter roggenkampii]